MFAITMPQRIYITRQALQVIEDEARRYAGVQGAGYENETGGFLIGRRLQNQPDAILIIVATGPGEQAVRMPFEFAPDIQHGNRQLSAIRERYPRTDYIGTWHKHPREYRMFSPGDVQMAHALFNDPSYVMNEIINPIVWVDDGQMTIRYYYMSRQMVERGQDFETLDVAVITQIDNNHPLVEDECSEPSISTNRQHLSSIDDRQQPKKTPIKNLEELRKILDGSEDVIVDSSGSIHKPNEPKVVDTPPQNRTALKPQRWFARPRAQSR